MKPVSPPVDAQQAEMSEGSKEERGKENQEAVRAKARKTETDLSTREVEEYSLDHAAFRSWRPRCMKGRGESYGHRTIKGDEKNVPFASVDHTRVHSERETEEEKGTPTLVRTAEPR